MSSRASTKRAGGLPVQAPLASLSRRVAQRADVIGVPVFSDLSSPEGAGVVGGKPDGVADRGLWDPREGASDPSRSYQSSR
jgi:hypothetical protein